MRKYTGLLLSIVLPIAVGVAAGVGLNWKSWAQSLSTTRSAVPYTASVIERTVAPDGSELTRFVRTVARRSDGSIAVDERRYYRAPDGRPLELPFRYIRDTEARTLVSIYPQVNARMTAQLTDRAILSLTSKPPANCVSDGFELDSGAGGLMAGHPVLIRKRQLVSSDQLHQGPSEREWVAPGMDCLVMRREAKRFDEKGVLRGTSITEVMEVTAGPPPRQLFAVPAELQEMTPSEVMAAQNRLQGIECTDCSRKAVENADRFYFAHRPASR